MAQPQKFCNKFQQDIATTKVFRRKWFVLYGIAIYIRSHVAS